VGKHAGLPISHEQDIPYVSPGGWPQVQDLGFIVKRQRESACKQLNAEIGVLRLQAPGK
jgi:hypothetical protein